MNGYVRLAITVSTARRQALVAAALHIPSPVVVSVLVDTGASCTCIDQGHLSQLGISPSGLANVHTSTTAGKPVQCQQFDVDIAVILDNGNPHLLGTFPVLESSLTSQGIDGLLGRDVLSRGVLFLNGSAGTLTLAF